MPWWGLKLYVYAIEYQVIVSISGTQWTQLIHIKLDISDTIQILEEYIKILLIATPRPSGTSVCVSSNIKVCIHYITSSCIPINFGSRT